MKTIEERRGGQDHSIDGQNSTVCDGQGLIEALRTATRWLEANSARINLLNVYPVPDGDTGTNMLLTMQAALARVDHESAHTVGEVAQAIYEGALMGARGNSGVILSQMLRGVADALQGRRILAPADLVAVFQEASAAAYKGVAKPVEGTMLTVIRDVASALLEMKRDDSLVPVMERAHTAAQTSVVRTPELLYVLRDAGVVDAGGEGISVILEGIVRYLRGQQDEQGALVVESTPVIAEPSTEEIQGYCTEFLIVGQDLDLEEIRAKMASLGNSLLVVGDRRLVRVHVHTTKPGVALEYGLESGSLHKVKIDNLEDQHREFLQMRAESRRETLPAEAANGISIVAVVTGDGLMQIFKSLGSTRVVYGGDTMNPSIDELLRAVEGVPSDRVILLPNDRNVIPVAEQVKSLASKVVEVVATKTMPQGISALLAFNYEADLGENVAAMRAAAGRTRTAQVARATRRARLDGLVVEEGQFLGLLDGQPVSVGGESSEVALAVLASANASEAEVITIYRGKGSDSEKAEALAQAVRDAYPDKQVELIFGGQPLYDYTLSVE